MQGSMALLEISLLLRVASTQERIKAHESGGVGVQQKIVIQYITK